MLNSFRTRNICEEEARFLLDRIEAVERTVAELCQVFGQYSRKAAHLRDQSDELAKTLLVYGESENVNRSLSVGLEHCAQSFNNIGGYGDKRVQSIDKKIIKEFARYEDICKRAKDDVRQINGVKEKEISKKRQLERLREKNPRNRQQIAEAETEVIKATGEVAKMLNALEEKSNTFERQKLHDIKTILQDFLRIEMGYHAKALEQLSKAYQKIALIDEESDLKDFQSVTGDYKKELKKTIRDVQKTAKTSGLRQRNTLGSLGNLLAAHPLKKPQGIPKKVSKSAETLDSMKKNMSESDDTLSDIDDNSDNLSESDSRTSPILVTRHGHTRNQS